MGKKSKSHPPAAPGQDVRRFLGLPVWQGIGALASVLALIVSIVIALVAQSGPTESRTQVNRDGDCAVQGNGNIVVCAPTAHPKSMGGIKFTWAPQTTGFLFKGSVSELPTPPAYPPDRVLGHCDAWERWRRTDPRAFEVMNTAELGLVGSKADTVAVRKVRTQIFRRTPLTKPYTFVSCTYGAGLDAGFYVRHSLSDNSSMVQEASSKKKFSMPPASAHLGEEGYVNGFLLINSSKDVLYEGAIIVTAVINGVEREYHYGTATQPLRWLGQGFERFSLDKAYDWDLKQKRWIKGRVPAADASESPPDSSPKCAKATAVTIPSGKETQTWRCPTHRAGPVYASPESNRRTGYLRDGNNWFVCQRRGRPNPETPTGKNNIWLYTQGDTATGNEGWGWFPATFVTYGENMQPVPGVPDCASDPP